MSDAQQPEGVRLLSPDGTEFECDVLRDEDADADGMAVWLIVPRSEVPAMAGKWTVKAALLPAMTELRLGT